MYSNHCAIARATLTLFWDRLLRLSVDPQIGASPKDAYGNNLPNISSEEAIEVSFSYLQNFSVSGQVLTLPVHTQPVRAEVRPLGRVYYTPLVLYENNPEVTFDVNLVNDLTGESAPLGSSPYVLEVVSALSAALNMTRFSLANGNVATAGKP